jgi:molybdopterin-guanine dinucleotide biosynthesis protein A
VTRIIGAILAGGGGTRLGGLRKADIRIGGQRLIDRVAGVLADHVDDLVIASGRFVLADLPKSARVVADEAESTMGPLAGMRASAAMAAPDDILVFAAVDTPFLPSDYVERLIAAARGPGAAYAAWGEAFYPTSSAWRVGTLKDSLQRHPPDSGPKLLLQSAGATRVDWASHEKTNPFSNLNTIADLITLQRRAILAGEGPGFPGL